VALVLIAIRRGQRIAARRRTGGVLQVAHAGLMSAVHRGTGSS
jgi:hypothetical protein